MARADASSTITTGLKRASQNHPELKKPIQHILKNRLHGGKLDWRAPTYSGYDPNGQPLPPHRQACVNVTTIELPPQ